jgi:prolyl-tRNA synthetase
MKQTHFALRTDKDAPHDAESINAGLLTRGGYVKKELSGVYSFLPLGHRVLKKIEEIIREEMDSVCAQQVLMPAITPRDRWEQTGRADVDIAYTPTENTILGWSHEEIVTPMAQQLIRSYKDLPKCLFQIQTKFRNEPRAKSGLLRGREFLMKDAYSFHATREDFQSYYETMAQAYFRIYERCGLESYKIEAQGGEFSKNISHEFAVVTPAGEDTMLFCQNCGFAQNTEVAGELKKGDPCPKCSEKIDEAKCVEVGNIFDLGTKYSDAFGFQVQGADGKVIPVIMGCYGIGVSRLMGTVVEASHDEKGIIWPRNIAPFQVHILSLREDKTAEQVAFDLEQDGYEVLCDDRNESPGKKLADADLIGIPLRIVISKRTLGKESAEVCVRRTGETHELPLHQLPHFVSEFFTK